MIYPEKIETDIKSNTINILPNLDEMTRIAIDLNSSFNKIILKHEMTTDDYNALIESIIPNIDRFEKKYLITINMYIQFLQYFKFYFRRDLNDMVLYTKQKYDTKNASFPGGSITNIKSIEWQMKKIIINNDKINIVNNDSKLYTPYFVINVFEDTQKEHLDIIRDYLVKIQQFIASFKFEERDTVIEYINDINNNLTIFFATTDKPHEDLISRYYLDRVIFLLKISTKLRDYWNNLSNGAIAVCSNYKLLIHAAEMYGQGDLSL